MKFVRVNRSEMKLGIHEYECKRSDREHADERGDGKCFSTAHILKRKVFHLIEMLFSV
jgi:hypothetical protein